MNNNRPCTANGRNATFHAWEQSSYITEPSPMIGGHTGGVLACIYAIVEYEDGTVSRCTPFDIVFTDKEVEDTESPIPFEEKKKDSVKREKIQCLWCIDPNNTNATLYANRTNAEHFVYCELCEIETIETFKTKATALKAFNDKKIIATRNRGVNSGKVQPKFIDK